MSRQPRPTEEFRWATNIVNDPTTLQNNRTTITLALKDSGWVPFGVKPARQKMNESLYQLGLWTDWNRDYTKYDQLGNNGVHLAPGVLGLSGTSSISIDSEKVTALLDNFTPAQPIAYTATSPGLFVRDNATLWTEAGSGLRSYDPAVDDVWVHIFLVMRSDTGLTDIISDTSVIGTNIKANADIIDKNYDHLKLIMSLPYINDGVSKFAPVIYSRDDMILYTEPFIVRSTEVDTSAAYVSHQLFIPTTVAANSIAMTPLEETSMKVVFRDVNGAVATPIIKSNTGAALADEPNFTEFLTDNVITFEHFDTIDGKFNMKSSSGGSSAELQVAVMGYKNPAVL